MINFQIKFIIIDQNARAIINKTIKNQLNNKLKKLINNFQLITLLNFKINCQYKKIKIKQKLIKLIARIMYFRIKLIFKNI